MQKSLTFFQLLFFIHLSYISPAIMVHNVSSQCPTTQEGDENSFYQDFATACVASWGASLFELVFVPSDLNGLASLGISVLANGAILYEMGASPAGYAAAAVSNLSKWIIIDEENGLRDYLLNPMVCSGVLTAARFATNFFVEKSE